MVVKRTPFSLRWMHIARPRSQFPAVASLVGLTLSLVACSSGGKPTVSATPTSAAGPTVAGAPQSAGGTCGGGAAAGGNGPEASPPGDIPDNQAFVTYRPPSAGFSVKVPEGWARSEQSTVVTFTDKFNSIRIDQLPAASAPTPASAEAELSGVASQSSCYEAAKVTSVTRQAGAAVLAAYRADSPPNPVTGKVVHQDIERYEFWHNGTEVALTLAAPKGSDNVDPWRKVTDSFSWQP
jgi:hypothetical protein